MYIAKLDLENYRSFHQKEEIQLGPYSVVIGPNNSGKSNVLRAINTFFSCLAFHSAKRIPAFEWNENVHVGKRHTRNCQIKIGLTFVFDPRLEADKLFIDRIQKHFSEPISRIEIRLSISQDLSPSFSCKPSPTKLATLPNILKAVKDSIHYEYVTTSRDRWTGRSMREGQLLAILVRTLTAPRRGRMSKLRGAIAELEKCLKEQFGKVAKDVLLDVKNVVQQVKDVKLVTPRTLLEHAFRFGQPDFIEVDDGVTTTLSQKGDGLQGLVLTSILRYIADQRGSAMVVWGFEEPEAHLHADAIRRLRSTLLRLSEFQQVLLTTHNPYLVNRTDLGQNIVVEKVDPKGSVPSTSVTRKSQTYLQIRTALGWSAGETMAASQVLVLVEGATEALLIPYMARMLRESGELGGDVDTMTVHECNGASKILPWARFLTSILVPCVALVDHDKAGTDAREQLLTHSLVQPADIFQVPIQTGRAESDFEDCLPPEAAVSALNAQFGLQLSPADIDVARRAGGNQKPGKWKDGAKRAIEHRGKNWEDFRETLFAESIKPSIRREHIPAFVISLLRRAVDLGHA